MLEVVDVIRGAVADFQKAIEDGHQSTQIDADDLIEVLLVIAERLEAKAATVGGCNAQC